MWQDSGNQGHTHISRRWNHRRQGCIVANSVLCWALFHRDPACTRVTLAAKVTMSTHQRIEAGNGARRSICAYLCCDAPLLSDGHSSHTITIFIPTDCHLSRLLVIAASRRLGRHSGHHRYSGEAGQIVEDHTQSRYSDKVAAMQSSATFDIGQAQSPPLLRRGRADDRRGPHTIAPL